MALAERNQFGEKSYGRSLPYTLLVEPIQDRRMLIDQLGHGMQRKLSSVHTKLAVHRPRLRI